MKVKQEKPEISKHYIRPNAANRKMKVAAGINQTIWIKGVCGSGKTSFALDYLKRRKFHYYQAGEVLPMEITIEESSKNTGKSKIVVIDDLYGITETDLQSEWKIKIEELVKREDIWLILISRANIPSWLYNLSVEHIFYGIEEEDLLLSRNQIEEYFASWQLNMDENLEGIWQRGKGNPLWCRICAIEMLQGKFSIENAQRSIWKYINNRVYDQWSSEMREALMKLSLLESFDLEMAVYMTGNNHVNVLLQQAMELGNFLFQRDYMWHLREPMCLSMIQRLHTAYDVSYINNLYIRAGDCFKIKGRLMGALKMYEKANSEQSIADLLIQNARENTSSGHFYEMRHYYLSLTEEYILQSVELMGAMSMLHSLLMNKEESERWYRELEDFSKKQTGSLKREATNKLLYLDIALPHRGTVGIIDILKNAGSLLLTRKAKLSEFAITGNLPSQMNGGKDFSEWSKKDKEIASSMGKIFSILLGRYCKGLINLALAESAFEKGENNYEVETLAVRGRMEAEAGGRIEQCFVSAGILARLSVFNNHIENARATLDGFYQMTKKEKTAPQLIANLQAFKCRLSLYQGRTLEISTWLKEAPREEEEFYVMDRYRYLTKVRVYLGDQKYQEAGILLEKLSYYAREMHRTYIAIETMLLQAILLERMGETRWKCVLQEAISQGEEYHFVRIFSREGAALAPLLRKETFTWKDKEFEKQVKEETTRMAEFYPMYLSTSTENGNLILPENAVKILRMQAMGKSTAEIADELGISQATVKYHNRETYRKLNVKTKAQAINEARNKKLI